MVATLYVANPPVAKECKYCGKHLDKWYAEIGICPVCLDNERVEELEVLEQFNYYEDFY